MNSLEGNRRRPADGYDVFLPPSSATSTAIPTWSTAAPSTTSDGTTVALAIEPAATSIVEDETVARGRPTVPREPQLTAIGPVVILQRIGGENGIRTDGPEVASPLWCDAHGHQPPFAVSSRVPVRDAVVVSTLDAVWRILSATLVALPHPREKPGPSR